MSKDIEECRQGPQIRIKRSKAGQEVSGATVVVPGGSIAAPVSAVLNYLKAAGKAAQTRGRGGFR
jgi:hypothetical protein